MSSTSAYKLSKKLLGVLRYSVLILLAILFLFPLYWMIVSALKSPSEIFSIPPRWVPQHLSFENYIGAMKRAPFFGRWMLNSAFVSSTVTLIALLLHAMAAYSLARLRYPGRRVIFYVVIGTLMIPFVANMVPLFVLIKTFGWINTYWALIIPSIPHAFGIFMLHQFYIGLPRELEEAAILDGCSYSGIFFRIVLPISRPVLAALAVFFFIANWNSFLWPLLVVRSETLKTIQLGLAGFVGPYENPWGFIMTANTIAILPTLVVFFILQKQLVASITITGIKG